MLEYYIRIYYRVGISYHFFLYFYSSMDIEELKQCIANECKQVPLSRVSSVGGNKSNKKGRAPQRARACAKHISSFLTDGSPGAVVIYNPHDIATIYMAGCFGKGTLSKGAPVGCFDYSEDLVLSPTEACYLAHENTINIFSEDDKLTFHQAWDVWESYNSHFPHQYVVYKHFRDKGYTVRSAMKYGGDFMLYAGDPNNCHAAYVVTVVGDDPQWTAMNAVRRVSESVAKESVLCYVNCKEGKVTPETVSSADVTQILLKRWMPERDRELPGAKNKVEQTGGDRDVLT